MDAGSTICGLVPFAVIEVDIHAAEVALDLNCRTWNVTAAYRTAKVGHVV